MLEKIHKTELIFGRTGRKMLRVASFLYYLRKGLENKYKLCCVVHFAYDGAMRRRGQAMRRGVLYIGTPKAHVPCGWHMKRHPAWTSYGAKSREQLRLFTDPNHDPPS